MIQGYWPYKKCGHWFYQPFKNAVNKFHSNLQKCGHHYPWFSTRLIWKVWSLILLTLQKAVNLFIQVFKSAVTDSIQAYHLLPSKMRSTIPSPFYWPFRKCGQWSYWTSTVRPFKPYRFTPLFACLDRAQVPLDRPWSARHGKKEKKKSDRKVEQIFRTRA